MQATDPCKHFCAIFIFILLLFRFSRCVGVFLSLVGRAHCLMRQIYGSNFFYWFLLLILHFKINDNGTQEGDTLD